MDAVRNGWGESCYQYIERFEGEIAKSIRSQYVLATSSCTGALHLGLSALGIGEGDEVVLADTNWVATVAPIVHLGARPVFVDIDPTTWCIDPAAVAAAITDQTKAVVATHLYGNLAHLDELRDISTSRNVILIEDAAEAWGSTYLGHPAGSVGRFGVFSFHGSKTLTTGEGGALVTDDGELYERVLTLSNHGRERGSIRDFKPTTIGYKFKMSNVQAAIGCAQLLRSDQLVSRRQEVLSLYREKCAVIDGVVLNPTQVGCTSGAWMPTLLAVDGSNRVADRMLAFLREAEIDGRPVFPPLSELKPFGSRMPCKNSRWFADIAINLPSFHDISESEIDLVVETVARAVEADRSESR